MPLLPASGVGRQVESPSESPEAGEVSAVSAEPEREERMEVEREEEAEVEEAAEVEVEREVEAEPQDAEPQEATAAREVAQEREAALVLSLSATDTACP